MNRGFTLIELLVVIVIIAILVSIAVPRMIDARQRSREVVTAANLSEIQKGLEQFAVDHNGKYPFRVHYFEREVWRAADFDPYTAVANGTDLVNSDDVAPDWFSMGLFGGVRVVNDEFGDNVDVPESFPTGGLKEHKFVQPYGWTHGEFYRFFNQHSDPLVALGYLDGYPENPFFKRPMGAVMWAYGDANWNNASPAVIDKTIPYARVTPTPGDFVYTHYYRTDGTALSNPEGIAPAKVSYQMTSETSEDQGRYYVDVVDSYQMWGYGALNLNGGLYVAYPNNHNELTTKGGQEASKDWDNSGTKDLYEMGMIAYFKSSATGNNAASDSGGNRTEF